MRGPKTSIPNRRSARIQRKSSLARRPLWPPADRVQPMTLRLYDLAGADPNRRFSPYCWRTRLALAHKGLAVETIPWRFTEKAAIATSGQGLVPVLVDGDRWGSDSWAIGNYLEDTHPGRPSLFGGGDGRNLTRFFSTFADGLVAAIFPFIALDILDRI